MNKRRILLVDDEIFILECLKIFMERSGVKILTASNFIEATKILDREEIDLLITDFNLKDELGDGADLINYCRLDKPLPAIIITGSDIQEVRNKIGIDTESAAVTEFILKPANLESLKKIVDRIFNS